MPMSRLSARRAQPPKKEPELLEPSPSASSRAKKEPQPVASSASASAATSSRSKQLSTVRSRALSERMYLLSRLAPEDGEATFLVAGISGKLYTVRLPVCASADARPRCNCPDFIFRRRACKHIQFVALRVLKLRQRSDVTLDSLAAAYSAVARAVEAHLAPSSPAAHTGDVMAPGEVQRAFEMVVPAHMRPANHAVTANPAPAATVEKEEEDEVKKEVKEEDHGVPIKPPEEGDECPICFEEFGEDDVLYCRIGCGKPVHASCMTTYAHAISDIPRCVLCRSPWEFANACASHSHSHSHSHAHSHQHANARGHGYGHGDGLGGLLSQQRIDRRRGMLLNGRLIDLSIVARNSFTSSQYRSYAYEEEEDDDDDDEEEEVMYVTGESQSEKAMRQRSERAARARRRDAEPAADEADDSPDTVQAQPRATRSRAGRPTRRTRAETTSASTPKKVVGKKKAPATQRKRSAPRNAQPVRRSTRTRTSARIS